MITACLISTLSVVCVEIEEDTILAALNNATAVAESTYRDEKCAGTTLSTRQRVSSPTSKRSSDFDFLLERRALPRRLSARTTPPARPIERCHGWGELVGSL